jgi:hypothetical protein
MSVEGRAATAADHDKGGGRRQKERRTMARTRITIEVTERDIERAHKNDSYRCIVAQAIARTVPDAARIEVDTQAIRFTTEGERRVYLTPYAVQGYVIAFDAGEPIEPFSFQLRNPVRSRPTRKTEVGKAAQRAADRARREARTAASYDSTKAYAGGQKRAKAKPKKVAEIDERAAAKAAYAEVTKAHPGEPTHEPSPGRRPPPRVFKRKSRAYGHRLLRINQDAE